ncbi:hypothetical protein JAAARDRAFT_31433 [Jaapia argillacea MUCL 33604]|uniref:Uncharacterized protein n=1 Tax=Jaapia argillacea MUCL 33604 TaxID=933084 RepID=A0A067Q730_9AGAM|nr:hypothetical protein JAAARDRAFT_31433 [Jaapia argillacea MUCL 33604]
MASKIKTKSSRLEEGARPQKKARILEPPPSIKSKTKGKPGNKTAPLPTAPPAVSFSTKSKGKGKEKEVISSPQPAQKSKPKSNPKPPKDDVPPPPPSSFKIIVGSYEKLLYGLECTPTLSSSSASSEKPDSYTFDLKPIFAFPAHVSCVKALAASPHGGKWLATGSADEIIKVWDLRRRKEIGGLMCHQGSITSLHFPSPSHLLSTSEDGTLSLFHTRDWSVLRTLKGHKGRVNSVAVHPSGKVALSVGKDGVLRMWDLMRGKGVGSVKLGREGEVVRWSTTGSTFAVQSQNTVEIYSTDMSLLHTITHPSRTHDLKFYLPPTGSDLGEVLLVAAEDKKVSVYDLPTKESGPEVEPKIVAEFVGHSNRVKAIATLTISLPGPTLSTTTILSTISSDGKVFVYNLTSLTASLATKTKEVVQIEPDGEYDTKGSRLTCLTLADGEAVHSGSGSGEKRKRVQENGSDGSDGEGGSDRDGDGDEGEEKNGEEEWVSEEEGEGEDEWAGFGN